MQQMLPYGTYDVAQSVCSRPASADVTPLGHMRQSVLHQIPDHSILLAVAFRTSVEDTHRPQAPGNFDSNHYTGVHCLYIHCLTFLLPNAPTGCAEHQDCIPCTATEMGIAVAKVLLGGP